MTTLKTFDDIELKQVAEEVPQFEDCMDLIKDMWNVMFQGRGVGLAANQVGVLKRIIVVQNKGFRQVLINPVITKGHGKLKQKEGCLSFPRLLVNKIRHKQITVEGFNEYWKPVKMRLKGMDARIVQHEVDHLNGVTIND